MSSSPYINGDTSFDACPRKTRFPFSSTLFINHSPIHSLSAITPSISTQINQPPPFHSIYRNSTSRTISKTTTNTIIYSSNQMASFNNFATIEPWMFRSTGADSWYPDAFARETESALTKALTHSFLKSEINHSISSSFLLNQNDYCSTTASASTVTAISGSGSDPETPGSKPYRSSLGVSTGKTTKRKSRASKRSVTTFIQADPANFRQMVQQVTGVKVEGNGTLPVSAAVKPEPIGQPFVNKLQGLLPTLDTSAYLLELQNSNTHRIPASGSTLTANRFSQLPATGQVTVNGGVGADFYAFSSFPTLESSI